MGAAPLLSYERKSLQPQGRSQWPPWLRLITWLLLSTALLLSILNGYRQSLGPPAPRKNCHHSDKSNVTRPIPKCPAQAQISPVRRPDITHTNVNGVFKSESFHRLSVMRLAGAVQIPTQTFQDMKPLGEDPRWDVFYRLEKYFKDTFPLIHERLDLEVVNEHGLLYTWHGSNKRLKPILLMGHQDTVPVAEDTRSEWKYDPFSGHFDGTYINGRGSHDCKNNIVAILSSITALLEQNFVPRRTIVLAFGFDEELGGAFRYGAAELALHLRKRWGSNSFAVVLDEGVIGIVKRFGRTFGIPQVAEKGYFDLELTVHVPGGHSSTPPKHTSIGILSEMVTVLEGSADKDFPLELSTNNPFYTFLQCAAEDDFTDISKELRSAIRDPEGAARVVGLLSDDPESVSLMHTTQAVTIFNSGNKANALPAFASALVNYRVSSQETLEQARKKLVRTLKPTAEKFGLNLTAGPKQDRANVPAFTLDLSWNVGLEPSPVSPSNSSTWTHFSGVIKHVFDEPGDGADVTVAPMYASGNTDTRYYWDLSSEIYRFGPIRAWHDEGWGGLHDVNERIALGAHLEAILFYHEFIRVFDEAELGDL